MKATQFVTLIAATATLLLGACTREDIAPQGLTPVNEHATAKLVVPTDNSGDKPDTADQTVVHIDANSKLYVNAIEVSESEAVARLQATLETKTDKIVYLKGDKDAPYSSIMKMMDALRAAQIESVGLITEKKGGNVTEGGGQ